jgi:hypothetical protein
MKKSIFMFVLMFAGCVGHRDTGNLVNGYKILAMNSAEIYVATPTDELIVGPTIRTIGIAGPVIVAYCGTEKTVANGFQNTTGYNVVNTRTGAVTLSLTEESMRAQLAALNIQVPKMQSPSELLR